MEDLKPVLAMGRDFETGHKRVLFAFFCILDETGFCCKDQAEWFSITEPPAAGKNIFDLNFKEAIKQIDLESHELDIQKNFLRQAVLSCKVQNEKLC